MDGACESAHDAEDAGWADGLLLFADAAARGGGARLEEVGAFILARADEGDGRFDGDFSVAEEGDDGGFPADGFGTAFWGAGVVVVVSVFVLGGGEEVD